MAICRKVRLFLFCALSACGQSDDVFLPSNPPDATTVFFETGSPFDDVVTPMPDSSSGPVYNGGPLACGTCTCDGTLYGCLEGAYGFDGGCTGSGPPPPPPPPPSDASADGAIDAGVSDAASCGKGVFCKQIPVACLPKPTCECIEKATGLNCMVTPNGNGFALSCP